MSDIETCEAHLKALINKQITLIKELQGLVEAWRNEADELLKDYPKLVRAHWLMDRSEELNAIVNKD